MTYEARQEAFRGITILLEQMSEPEADIRQVKRNGLGCVISIALFLISRAVQVHLPFYVEILVACLIGFGLAQWRLSKQPKPKTRQEALDSALSEYEPADAEAFRSFQEDTVASGRLRKEAYIQWQMRETDALRTQAGITAACWNFVTQR